MSGGADEAILLGSFASKNPLQVPRFFGFFSFKRGKPLGERPQCPRFFFVRHWCQELHQLPQEVWEAYYAGKTVTYLPLRHPAAAKGGAGGGEAK